MKDPSARGGEKIFLRKRETGTAESGAISGRIAARCVREREEEVTVTESLTDRERGGETTERGRHAEKKPSSSDVCFFGCFFFRSALKLHFRRRRRRRSELVRRVSRAA